MATKKIELKGTIGFAKIFEPDEFRGVRFWSVDWYPKDMEEMDIFKKSGVTVRPKELPSEEFRVKYNLPAGKYYRFRRPTQKLIKGDIVHFRGPEIVIDGKTVGGWEKKSDGSYVFEGDFVPVGNGSKAIITLVVYDTPMGPGHRLEKIEVVDLVVYEKPEDAEPKASENEEEAPIKKVPW